MRFQPTSVPGVIVIEPDVHEDARGFFFESYSRPVFARHGIAEEFVQENHSRSRRGVLRGLHFQVAPAAQAKLVRVAAGEAFDVAVDLRPGSPTYGRHVAETLSAANRRMLYIPEGFAHGFVALADGTDFLYKVSRPYSPEHERGVLWSDPDLGIAWPAVESGYAMSERDRLYPRLKELAGAAGRQKGGRA